MQYLLIAPTTGLSNWSQCSLSLGPLSDLGGQLLTLWDCLAEQTGGTEPPFVPPTSGLWRDDSEHPYCPYSDINILSSHRVLCCVNLLTLGDSVVAGTLPLTLAYGTVTEDNSKYKVKHSVYYIFKYKAQLDLGRIPLQSQDEGV